MNVKTIRQKTQLTQDEFAAAFGISVATLRHWERGDRKPQGLALVLLNLVRKSPDTILTILNEWSDDELPVEKKPSRYSRAAFFVHRFFNEPHPRSKRSRFMTLFHAATKSCTNFSQRITPRTESCLWLMHGSTFGVVELLFYFGIKGYFALHRADEKNHEHWTQNTFFTLCRYFEACSLTHIQTQFMHLLKSRYDIRTVQ